MTGVEVELTGMLWRYNCYRRNGSDYDKNPALPLMLTGHGDYEVSRGFAILHAEMPGIAILEEGIQLRDKGKSNGCH